MKEINICFGHSRSSHHLENSNIGLHIDSLCNMPEALLLLILNKSLMGEVDRSDCNLCFSVPGSYGVVRTIKSNVSGLHRKKIHRQ